MNGNGTWRAVAFGIAGLVMTSSMALSGWALSSIGILDREISDTQRSVADLWLWVRAEQMAGEKWHDSEKAYDVTTQDRIDRTTRDTVDELRRINDRINVLAVVIGRSQPRSDIPP